MANWVKVDSPEFKAAVDNAVDRALSEAPLSVASKYRILKFGSAVAGAVAAVGAGIIWVMLQNSAEGVARRTATDTAKQVADEIAKTVADKSATDIAQDVALRAAKPAAEAASREETRTLVEDAIEAAKLAATDAAETEARRVSREVAKDVGSSAATDTARRVAEAEARIEATRIAERSARDAARDFVEKDIVERLLDDKSFAANVAAEGAKFLQGAVVAFSSECPGEFGWVPFDDANGRVVVGVGSLNDEQETREFSYGDTGGRFRHKLTIEEMPSHDHPGSSIATGGPLVENASRGSGTWLSDIGPRGDRALSPVSDIVPVIAPQGQGQAHNNMQPYIALYICEKLPPSAEAK